MRDLVAALEQMRTRILRVITALEQGDKDRALAEIELASAEWADAVEELRSAA